MRASDVALSVVVRLRHGRYDAARTERAQAEWPPAPARVFCALVASVRDEADREALRWLEREPLPQVWDPGEAEASLARSYVVTNRTVAKAGSQSWPGRTNNERVRASATPSADRFAIVWPQAEPEEAVLKRLHRLALRVPYVGRSTSLAEVTVHEGMPDAPASGRWRVFRSVPLGAQGVDLAAPYPGYLAALSEAYEVGRRAHEVARTFRYATQERETQATSGPVLGPFRDLVIWGVRPRTVPVEGGHIPCLVSALRSQVMGRLGAGGRSVPDQVHGHGADDRTHVAFLALPYVGSAHADGHVLGLAMALPRDLPQESWVEIGRSVLVDPLTELRANGGRQRVQLAPAGSGMAWGLQPGRWTGGEEGAREWVTATPVVPDGRLRRGRTHADLVVKSLLRAGYPEPVSVETSQAPMVEGAMWRPTRGAIPDRYRDRHLCHARVTFDRPVVGPVIAGAMRYTGGLGLFVPRLSYTHRSASRTHPRGKDDGDV
ncbi:type I-G CRISPR-associated protein Csb2 [Streptomyces qinglanensis]|uniref:type I-G CRISPR-associated protein Csb2 n=1 Tax=Streptomyces qinglanensis TaxID=943816 RepID=UPI0037AD55CB